MVSIVIPAYNAGAFVEKTIKSILNQRYQDFEIIVVNDGSTDNTLEILERLAKSDSRIVVINQENGGVSAARNTALKHVKGEFITYVDADDSVPKNHLEDLVALMTDDVDFVVGSHDEIRFRKNHHTETPAVYTKDEIEDNFIEFDAVVWWPWGKLFRTSVIKDNNLTYDVNITFGEDHIFNILYAKHMKGKTVVTDKIVYNYHFIRGGLCSKFYQEMDYLQMYVYLKIADYFDGINTIPRKYHIYYVGAYLKGNLDYYISWQTINGAAKSLEQCFNTYAPLLADDVLEASFTPKQLEFIKAKEYKKLAINYMLNNPKKTIWRKFRRTVRRFLEMLQRIFLGRK